MEPTPPAAEDPWPLVRQLAEDVHAAGGRAWLVGGSVRDALRGEARKDWDLEVFGLAPERLEALVRARHPVHDVGRSFGVLKLRGLPVDLALPRVETKVAAGHRGFAVDADPHLDLPTAARRRDLTVNAIYEDPRTGEIQDPLGGREDLARAVLRHCSERFAEDPLRLLRVMQLAARLDFTVHPDTVALCRTLDLAELPRERVEQEWRKLLLQGVRPSRGLAFLQDADALRFTPELATLVGTPQHPEWHPEGDVWVHTLHCLDHFARHRHDDAADWPVGLGILCHDLGKPPTTVQDGGVWRSPAHDVAGEEPTRRFLARLTVEADLVEQVVALVRHHLRPFEFHRDQAGDAAIRRLAAQVDLRLLVRVAWSDHAGRPPLPDDGFPAGRWLLQRAEELRVKDQAPQPLVLGRHLIQEGEQPGPHFKALLDACFEAQLDGVFHDRDGGIAHLRRLLRQRRGGADGTAEGRPVSPDR